MSYGYRLNAEQIFFRLADESFEKAEQTAAPIEDADMKGNPLSFVGYPTDEGLASAVLAVVGWAACLESFVNLAWNKSIGEKLPSPRINRQLLKSLSTLDKAKEILILHQQDPKSLPHWRALQSMIDVRNRFVHYKDNVVYQGFEFAAPWERELSQKHCREFRTAISGFISLLANCCNLDSSFTTGTFSIVDRYT